MLQLQIQRFSVQTLIICLTKLWDPTSFQDSQGPLHQLSKIVYLLIRWTKVGLGTTKFFHENFHNTKLYQLTKYQDQNFTLPDIKQSVFLKSSLGTWTLEFIIKNQQRSRKEKRGEKWSTKTWYLEDKRIFFGKTKSIFDNFLKVLFW